MKLLQTVIIGLLISLMLVPYTAFATAGSRIIPEKINVGIRFGTSATPIVGIYSKTGLELGTYIGNEFKPIYSFLQNNEIMVRKDSFFMNLNGSFIEYKSDELNDLNNANLQGPIHIQIGDTFSTKEAAEASISALPALGEAPYISYEDGWKVWIGLYTSMANAERAIAQFKTSAPELKFSIIPQDSKRIQVVDRNGKVLFMYNSEKDNYMFRSIPSKDAQPLIRVDGKNFRGTIHFKRYSDSDLTVINQLSLEEYLYGVLPREISGLWPMEAQKAQAVAARTYAIVNMNRHLNHGFDVCSTTHCQVYGGYDAEHVNSTKAVDQTKGKLLTFNGNPVTAFYHSNSGGRTENSENVWSNALGYIKGVDDPYSIGNPNDTWTFVYTKQEIEERLNARDLSVGTIRSITPIEYSINGRVLKLEIIGSNNTIILEKDRIRNVLGYNNIRSTWFEIQGDSDSNISIITAQGTTETILSEKHIITSSGVQKITEPQNFKIFDGSSYMTLTDNSNASSNFVFTGKGWGHGLGMSQWGAKTMADRGYTYEQILLHYYTGVKVEKGF